MHTCNGPIGQGRWVAPGDTTVHMWPQMPESWLNGAPLLLLLLLPLLLLRLSGP